MQSIHMAGRVVYNALQAMGKTINPGVSTTNDLEEAAIKVISDAGGSSAFLGYSPYGCPPYPAWTCISVNNEVVHGIPGRRILQPGDIVSCDVGVILNGFVGDSAWTFPVGEVSPEAEKLMKATLESLHKGIQQAVVGRRIGDVGHAVQQHARRNGYSVVKELVGHGVGKQLHEEPQIPNYGKPRTGVVLREGMTLAIEPMVNGGHSEIEILSDEWTIVTRDGKLSAHFEHTVAITRHGPQILTGPDEPDI